MEIFVVKTFADYSSERVLGVFDSLDGAQGCARMYAPYKGDLGTGFGGAVILKGCLNSSDFEEVEEWYCARA